MRDAVPPPSDAPPKTEPPPPPLIPAPTGPSLPSLSFPVFILGVPWADPVLWGVLREPV